MARAASKYHRVILAFVLAIVVSQPFPQTPQAAAIRAVGGPSPKIAVQYINLAGDYAAVLTSGGTMEGTVLSLILRTLTHLSGHAQEILFMTRLQLRDKYQFKHPAGVPPSMRARSG